jgi:hypothetical protein
VNSPISGVLFQSSGPFGNEDYVVGADGLLMPANKGQARPDLRHFN